MTLLNLDRTVFLFNRYKARSSQQSACIIYEHTLTVFNLYTLHPKFVRNYEVL